MDRGPWKAFQYKAQEHGKIGKFVVGSDDFKHDVWLYVSGDFGTHEEHIAYCNWLADVLNKAASAERNTQIIEDNKDKDGNAEG